MEVTGFSITGNKKTSMVIESSYEHGPGSYMLLIYLNKEPGSAIKNYKI